MPQHGFVAKQREMEHGAGANGADVNGGSGRAAGNGSVGSGGGSGFRSSPRWRMTSGRVTHATRVADAARGDYTLYQIEVDLEMRSSDAAGATQNGCSTASENGNGRGVGDGASNDDSDCHVDSARDDGLAEAGGSYSCESTRIRQLGRRYSDFLHLDASIRSAGLPSSVLALLPTLPTTFTFNKFSDSVVHARRTALDLYVRALLTIPSSGMLTALPEVHTFFEEEEEDGDAVESR